MALPNRLHTALYDFMGGSIKLQASFAALEALKAEVGSDPVLYIGEALDITSPYQLVERVTNIMFHLQVVESENARESKASINAWLFGVMDDFFTEANTIDIAKAFAKVMGKDIAEAIGVYEANKKADTKKKPKPSTSDHLEQPSVI